MRLERITFERLTQTFSKSVPCKICGKKVRRQRTIGQTISPFNKNAEGQPASRGEIYAKIRAEGEEWIARSEVHPKCLEALPEATP